MAKKHILKKIRTIGKMRTELWVQQKKQEEKQKMTKISRDLEPYVKRNVDDSVYVEMGKRIRSLREQKRYSRERVAEELQVSTKYLYEIEFGKKRCTSHILAHLSLILSVSCDYLVFGIKDDARTNEKVEQIVELLDERQIRQIHEVSNTLDEIWTILKEKYSL